MTYVVETSNFTRRFRGYEVVHGNTLAVPRGSVWGLLGRNGAGKITTGNMLGRLLWSTADSATLRGRDKGGLELFRLLERLQQRFRQMKVIGNPLADLRQNNAIAFERSDGALRFVHPDFTPKVESKLMEQFGTEKVRAHTMPVRDMFVALAKSYQEQKP
ncbi:MAG: ATP-binding cassette domain-containing protein [Verrucomicrobiota bacterium]|nr:ATP-binding cassette domain-containing protein [Verrucomicrobiota bacterium]